MDYFPSKRVTSALKGLAPAVLRQADARIRREVRRREMYFHFRKDVRRYIPMAIKPWIVLDRQRRYLRRVCLAVQSASLRVLPLWFERRDLQSLLPLTDEEQRWIRDAYGGRFRRPETLMPRFDIATPLGEAGWRERMRLLEVNLVGIGATYYCYCAGQIAGDVLAPLVGAKGLSPEDDLLELIMSRCREHGRRIGCPDPTVAMMEYRRSNEGPFEFETMARLYRARGHRVVVADPIELSVSRGRLMHGGTRVDILYRDPTLLDLVGMEAEGDDLRAVRHAFRENRVVSSLGGEVDHKSLLEVFTSRRTRGIFAAGERAVLARHVPWTRALRAGSTDGPDGRDVDLAEYARRRREGLLIKPNRDYGGRGITIGMLVSAGEWDRVLEEGVRHPARYVVQERIPFNEDDYPLIANGRVRWARRYVVTGVHAGRRETVILGRMSGEPVVNITRGGAIVGVLRKS